MELNCSLCGANCIYIRVQFRAGYTFFCFIHIFLIFMSYYFYQKDERAKPGSLLTKLTHFLPLALSTTYTLVRSASHQTPFLSLSVTGNTMSRDMPLSVD